jgi:hypothetical protein
MTILKTMKEKIKFKQMKNEEIKQSMKKNLDISV